MTLTATELGLLSIDYGKLAFMSKRLIHQSKVTNVLRDLNLRELFAFLHHEPTYMDAIIATVAYKYNSQIVRFEEEIARIPTSEIDMFIRTCVMTYKEQGLLSEKKGKLTALIDSLIITLKLMPRIDLFLAIHDIAELLGRFTPDEPKNYWVYFFSRVFRLNLTFDSNTVDPDDVIHSLENAVKDIGGNAQAVAFLFAFHPYCQLIFCEPNEYRSSFWLRVVLACEKKGYATFDEQFDAAAQLLAFTIGYQRNMERFGTAEVDAKAYTVLCGGDEEGNLELKELWKFRKEVLCMPAFIEALQKICHDTARVTNRTLGD
jgi:hypothetical protein